MRLLITLAALSLSCIEEVPLPPPPVVQGCPETCNAYKGRIKIRLPEEVAAGTYQMHVLPGGRVEISMPNKPRAGIYSITVKGE